MTQILLHSVIFLFYFFLCCNVIWPINRNQRGKEVHSIVPNTVVEISVAYKDCVLQNSGVQRGKGGFLTVTGKAGRSTIMLKRYDVFFECSQSCAREFLINQGNCIPSTYLPILFLPMNAAVDDKTLTAWFGYRRCPGGRITLAVLKALTSFIVAPP